MFDDTNGNLLKFQNLLDIGLNICSNCWSRSRRAELDSLFDHYLLMIFLILWQVEFWNNPERSGWLMKQGKLCH